MSLLETIKKDMIEASKKGDVDSTNILKLAIASIKNEEIAKGSKLSDEEILKVLRKEESNHGTGMGIKRAGSTSTYFY